MSTWTHVNGSIRIDSLRMFGDVGADKIKEALGEIIDYEHVGLLGDKHDECPEIKLPCGSEGSLSYVIWENPSKSSMAAFTVNVFGDLRDYDDYNKVFEWFSGVCSKFMVRSAIIEVQVNHKPYLARWFGETKTFVQVEFAGKGIY